ncbi:MAG: SMP-30/gluconolactonase/LRE family protein [Bacteroidetes bacterium]|nr:SMP-30/gluconolactonase/LRE family protein [Bacteroidota bacterium]
MLTVVYNAENILGEGPVWDKYKNRILWVDILNRSIHSYSLEEKKHNEIAVDGYIGAIAVESEDIVIAAIANTVCRINIATGKTDVLKKFDFDKENIRFNDGKCDARGRFWIGTMSINGKGNKGNLYCLDHSTICNKISNVGCSNGIIWSVDNKKLYYIDSAAKRVDVYDFDIESGNILNPHVLIEFSDADGIPDGMTIDTAGTLWIAFWDGWKVEGYDSSSGKLVHTIKMPVARPTSCVFGGKDLNYLFITSAKTELTQKELLHQPLAGSLFMYGPLPNAGCVL